ncbi:MAG: hypothetical protein HRU32_15275, partial [Rhodobacteraceae bacterium]|nr:hypothetical protein [Paracoccaceae bacterium]
ALFIWQVPTDRVLASTTVGYLCREGAILRLNILPTLYYVGVAGIIGMIAVGLPVIFDVVPSP